LPDSSTKGREKRWTLNHPQSVLTNVLHPSVELTAHCRPHIPKFHHLHTI